MGWIASSKQGRLLLGQTAKALAKNGADKAWTRVQERSYNVSAVSSL